MTTRRRFRTMLSALVAALLACAAHAAPGEPAAARGVAGKRVLMVIAPRDFRDEELFETREVLEQAGFPVEVASLSRATATGMLGARVTPSKTVAEVKVSDYAAVVFVGGSGAGALVANSAVLSLARGAYGAGKIVAAICIAPEILAEAGLLSGKRATAWSGSLEKLRARGAKVESGPVVRSDRIITGNGPGAAGAFGRAIAEALTK